MNKRARFINMVNNARGHMYKLATHPEDMANNEGANTLAARSGHTTSGGMEVDEVKGQAADAARKAREEAEFNANVDTVNKALTDSMNAWNMESAAKKLRGMARGDAAIGGAIGAAGGAGAAYILAKILKLKKAWIYALGGGALGAAGGAMGGGSAMNAMRGWLDKRHARRSGLQAQYDSNLKEIKDRLYDQPDEISRYDYLAGYATKDKGLSRLFRGLAGEAAARPPQWIREQEDRGPMAGMNEQ